MSNTEHAFVVPVAANDNGPRARIEYDTDGSIIRVIPATTKNPLRCRAKPHGLGKHPSVWKAVADHDRIRLGEVENTLRYEHVMKRAATWTKAPVPANDNQAWPLLQSLRKDGNEALIPVAEDYRAMYDRAIQEPLAGTWHNDLYVVPKYAKKDDADNHTKGTLVTVHVAGNMAGGHVVRESTKLADHRFKEGLQNPPRRTVSKAKEWHGEDNIVAVIDARTELARYQSALGPLLDAFEDAVLHSATLTEIGEAMGAASKTGGAVGKAMVMLGLEVIQEAMGISRRERRHAA